jgi:hypothetical protein
MAPIFKNIRNKFQLVAVTKVVFAPLTLEESG